MISVAFDIHAIGHRATGNETYAAGLLRAFEAAPPTDVEFHFYHFGMAPPTPRTGQVHRVWPAWPYARIPLAMPILLARHRIDVAHFQYFAPPWKLCPQVLTIHDISFERHPDFFSRAMAWRMRSLVPFMARRASHVITVSEASRSDLIDLYGLPADRVSVIYNGLPDGFHELPPALAAQRVGLRLNCERPVLLCVGNLGARKNQERLVRVFGRLVREKGCDHDLVMVGNETSSAAPVFAEIARQQLGDRIHRLGYVDQNDLVALYNFATLSIYPSFYEGFGLPILESMACGTPVITSSTSCMPEIAGDAACLIDPSDDDMLMQTIEDLLDDSERREEMRLAGLARCETFSWAQAAQRTLDVYRRVANA